MTECGFDFSESRLLYRDALELRHIAASGKNAEFWQHHRFFAGRSVLFQE
jgi:hypothetical protein